MGKTVKQVIDIVSDIIAPNKFGEDADDGIQYRYASMLKPGDVVVDFGTGQGRTACVFGLSNPDIFVYTFDKGLDDHHIPDSEYVMMITDRLKQKGMQNVYFTLGHSLEVYPDWNKEISLLNIDSNHGYATTKAEIERWEPFVKHGGYLLFHDYVADANFPGVTKAVDEMINTRLDKYQFIEHGGWTSVWKKR